MAYAVVINGYDFNTFNLPREYSAKVGCLNRIHLYPRLWHSKILSTHFTTCHFPTQAMVLQWL